VTKLRGPPSGDWQNTSTRRYSKKRGTLYRGPRSTLLEAADVDLRPSRDVVEDGGDGDVGDVTAAARQRADGRRVVRPADGRVAVERDEHRQQDGRRQRHEVERPEVRHDDHVEAMERAEVARVDVDRLEAVQRQTGDEHQRVGDRQRSQQEDGGDGSLEQNVTRR